MKITPLQPRGSWLIALLLLGISPCSSQELRQAPNLGAGPVNQLVIAGNACGPAALLSAFRFGDPAWQKVSDSVKGGNDKQRLSTIIREVAMRPSKHLVGRPRWSRAGVNIADLCDMANEMGSNLYVPQVGFEILFLKPGESSETLLERTHRRLEKSLAKGFPPLLSIRRFAKRKVGWTGVEGHFVTVIGLPKKLPGEARSFSMTYLDPWGGKRCEGQITIPAGGLLSHAGASVSPCLEALFPQAMVGKNKVAKGEVTGLAVSAVLGRW